MFAQTLTVTRTAPQTLAVAALTLLQWTAAILASWFAARSLPGLDLDILDCTFIFVITALAVSLPQAPAYVGSFHIAADLGAQWLGAPTHLAKSFAIVIWLLNTVPILITGSICLWHEGLSVSHLTHTQDDHPH